MVKIARMQPYSSRFTIQDYYFAEIEHMNVLFSEIENVPIEDVEDYLVRNKYNPVYVHAAMQVLTYTNSAVVFNDRRELISTVPSVIGRNRALE